MEYRYRHLLIFLLPSMLLLASCAVIQLDQSKEPAKANEFVIREGQQLIWKGKPFHFLGINRYNLLTIDTPYRGCGEGWSNQQLNTYFAELQTLHVNVIRFWAFQPFTASGSDFSRFDYLLSLAKKYNIFLLPVLENQWPSCTQSAYKFNTWYQNGYLHPYDSYHLSYKDYVHIFVLRYKDNPYIIMWQLMNEVESQTTKNGSDSNSLFEFAKNMSAYIKSIDSNHLVNLGTIGNEQAGTEGLNYRRIYSIPTLDILEVHDYGQERVPLPDFVLQRLADAKALGKPIFVGESGIQKDCTQTSCFTLQQRAALFQAKIDAFFSQNGSGYLIWSYRDKSSSETWEFDLKDPLAQVVKNMSSKYLNTP